MPTNADQASSANAELIDIGANLTHDSFDADRQQVIADAQAAGVVQMVVTGSSEACSRQGAQLAEDYPGVLTSTAGIHPHHASEFTAEAEAALVELLALPQVVAVGETGLDYFRDFSPRPAQLFSFEQHIALACETGLPMFLHQRDAHSDFLPILKAHRDALSEVVVHCFTDTREALFDYLDLDCHIGVTGWICDERRGKTLQEIVHNIPDHRLLVETDAPYLLPRDLDPKPSSRRNEPKYLPHVVKAIAHHRQQDWRQVARISSENARRFFRLD